jgi:hypothetical protein
VVGRRSLKIIGTNGVRLDGDEVPRIKQAIRKKALPLADVEIEIDPNRPGVLVAYLVETFLNTGCKIPTWDVAP